ncbi:MAG: hypothetical protein WKG52_07495 [Variovorax sp.]
MQASITLIPSGTGGVRDYASLLGSPLQTPIMELTQTTDTSALSGDLVLLHFSGYGYQKRGVPLWLIDRVRSLRTRFNAVGVVFHELFASGPPWSSAFWLHGYQKRIARDLLGLADFWLTNREVSARWLHDQYPLKPHRVLPVFSNVGEPAAIETDRQPTMVVFGSWGIRRQVYQWANGEVFRSAKRHGLEIHDIGPAPEDDALSKQMAQEGVVVRGKLPAEQVSRELSAATFGALTYPVDCASKSGVFAAYCAHSLCPILLWKDYGVYDGLEADVHYLAGFDAIGASDTNAASIARAARAWYEPHRVDAHVAALKTLMTEARR